MKKYILITVFSVLFFNSYSQITDSVNVFKDGKICFEKGCQMFSLGRYPQALYWYEKGIEQSPLTEENYYGAAQVFFLSTETVWGVMYGELFMILSQQDSLKQQVSKQLFDSYFSSVTLSRGNNSTAFNTDIIVYSDSFERFNNFPLIFDSLMTECVKNVRFIDISALITIRKQFLSKIKSKAKDFDNPLFAYWDKIINAGYWQAYNYWLFAYGNTSESATWARQNQKQWNDFLSWQKKNPININNSNYFSRYLME